MHPHSLMALLVRCFDSRMTSFYFAKVGCFVSFQSTFLNTSSKKTSVLIPKLILDSKKCLFLDSNIISF